MIKRLYELMGLLNKNGYAGGIGTIATLPKYNYLLLDSF
jgi:hypothetical protein